MAVCNNTSLTLNGNDSDVAEMKRQVEHYVTERGIPIVSALGLVGNFLSLLVLTKEKLHKSLTKMEISAHIGLIALAVSDFLFCLMVLLVTLLPLKDSYQPGEILIYFKLLHGGLITIFIITSTWLIVVMAAERYVAVCHPLKARNLISLCRTRTYVIVLFVLCPLCTVPVFMEKFIQKVTCPDGRVLYTVEDVQRDNVFVRRIVWALCFDFVPCVALVYFNACLIWKIHKAKQLRQSMAPLQGTLSVSSNSGYAHASTKVRRFRWDSNSRSLPSNRHSCDDIVNGDGEGFAANKRLMAGTRHGRGKKYPQDTHAQDLLESSESNEHSHSNANSVGEGEQRREMHLLCKQGLNGTVKTSSRLTPKIPPPNQNARGRPNRSMSSKRRFSDNALNSVTATLVAVVLTFLILVSPWELLKFGLQYTSRGDHNKDDKDKFKIALILTNFMQVVNFSFNFVLYCLVNKSFRNTLYKLLCFRSMTKSVK